VQIGGDCTHVAALLLIILNLFRAESGPTSERKSESTAVLCAWNVLSPGMSYDFMQPIPFLPLTKDDLDKPVKKRHLARDSSWGRGAWNPFADAFSLRCRSHPAVVEAAKALYEELE
jgi:hypothetical protein